MPNVSAAHLKELEHRVEVAEAGTAVARIDAARAEARVVQFDAILTKVIAACDGRPLSESGDRYYGAVSGSAMNYDVQVTRMTQEERLEQEVALLHQRIVQLECRLAATRAVAEFAKFHKA